MLTSRTLEEWAEINRLRREARAAKKIVHCDCPHETQNQLTRLNKMLDRVAPANIASTPIAMMLENGIWTVDITVRIRGVTDYGVSGDGATLAAALSEACRALTNRAQNERESAASASRYGYTL